MSEPTKEEMLDWIDNIIEERKALQELTIPVDVARAITEDIRILDAIRTLIEKFFGKNGWQEKADIINDEDYPGIPVNNLRKAYNLILEIRDFGKEGEGE